MVFELTVLINKEINQMNFFSKNNVKVIMRPLDAEDKSLMIKENTFLNIPFNVVMSDFNFIIKD